jgi:hypothetical protein
LRQPIRHFVAKAECAVYLDANFEPFRPCRNGCVMDDAYNCIHRFSSRIYVVPHQSRASFLRLSDIQVVLDFLFVILERWKHGTKGVWGRRYIILTNDRHFLNHAERAWRKERNKRKLPLRFEVDRVVYHERECPWDITVEVHHVHTNHLRDAIEYARTMLAC